MPVKTILYIIVLASGSGSATIDSQEFDDVAACNSAKDRIVADFRAMGTTAELRAVCVPKSSATSE